jgi:hypothetical protein
LFTPAGGAEASAVHVPAAPASRGVKYPHNASTKQQALARIIDFNIGINAGEWRKGGWRSSQK